jgi:hypothetical protein
MRIFAEMVIDLLSLLTFQPKGGNDPEDVASLEGTCWQTLLNDLNEEERNVFAEVVAAKVSWLRNMSTRPEHLDEMLNHWEAFLRGELR